MSLLRKTYFTIVFLCISVFSHAEEHPFPKESRKSLLLGYGGNYPVDKSAEKFSRSIYHPIIGVRHMGEDWVLGVSMQFKILKDKADDSKLVLWTLEEELNYRIRLYHPLYFLIGAKTMYLYPVRAAKYPFRRRTEFNPEVGVAATASFLYLFGEKTGVGLFADLWRGTATRKYQGLELGMHLVFPLPF